MMARRGGSGSEDWAGWHSGVSACGGGASASPAEPSEAVGPPSRLLFQSKSLVLPGPPGAVHPAARASEVARRMVPARTSGLLHQDIVEQHRERRLVVGLLHQEA